MTFSHISLWRARVVTEINTRSKALPFHHILIHRLTCSFPDPTGLRLSFPDPTGLCLFRRHPTSAFCWSPAMGAVGDGHFHGELENCADLRYLDTDESLDLVDGTGSGSQEVEGDPIEDAVRVLLRGLGEDCEREGLRRTPRRVAKAFRDGTRGYKQKVSEIVQGALFPEAGLNSGKGLAGGVGGLVVVRDVDLFSYCESCLLPFRVECHIGYVPAGKRVVGLSKLSRVADVFAKRLQSPQRLADDVCSSLQDTIKPAGVVVALQCWHIGLPEELNSDAKCSSKLKKQGWLQLPVCSGSGVFEDGSGSFWEDFSAILKLRGVNVEKAPQHSSMQTWCPLTFPEMTPCNGHEMKHVSNGGTFLTPALHKSTMVAAATSILHAIGEDPSRKELTLTPYRYVQWMMRFKRCSFDVRLNGSNHMNGMQSNGHVHDRRKVVHAELNLPFCAQCEHHLLPFQGVVHVGYLTTEGAEDIERSKLQSLVCYYGCKFQVQERLTRQVAEAVFQRYTEGVMAVVEASHTCMISRGIEKVGSNTATIAVLGRFSTDSSVKEEFLQKICAQVAQ